MRRPSTTSVRVTAVLLASLALSTAPSAARADDYFRGDGTTYTLGEVGAGNCNMMTANADAGDNYAALNDVQWNGLKNCGRCAQVSCDDDRCADKSASQVVQILDRCPECKHGDLDLSPSVFKKLTKSDPSRYKIKWKFVDCPVQGSVKFCLKGGSNPFWTAIQPANAVSGVTSLKVNGQATTMVDSAYYYLLNGNSQAQTDLSAVKVTITSVGGETVTDTVSLTAGACTSSSVQFARGGGSSGEVQNEAAPSTQPYRIIKSTPSPASASLSPSPSAAPTLELTQGPSPLTPTPVSSHASLSPTASNAPSGSLAPSTVPPTFGLTGSPTVAVSAPSTTASATISVTLSTSTPPSSPQPPAPSPSVSRCRAKSHGGDSSTR